MVAEQPRCATCTCFDPHGGGRGLCRAKPPEVTRWADTRQWPIVTEVDWCGRHPLLDSARPAPPQQLQASPTPAAVGAPVPTDIDATAPKSPPAQAGGSGKRRGGA